MNEQLYVPMSEYLEAIRKAAEYKAGFIFSIILCGIFMVFSLFVLWVLLKKDKKDRKDKNDNEIQ